MYRNFDNDHYETYSAVPYVNKSLQALNETKTVDVLGTMVDIKVRPARIDVDIPGAVIELDTQIRAHNDSASPGFEA